MSEYLSADNILEAKDLAVQDVTVPEWPDAQGNPGIVCLRQLSAEGMMRMTEDMNEHPKEGMFIILVHTACDKDRQPVFPLPEDEDARKEQLAQYVKALKGKNFKVLNVLQFAAMKVNDMGPRVPGAIKNASSGAVPDASPTSSPKS